MTMTMTTGSTSHPGRRPVRPTSTYIRGLHATVWQEALRRTSGRRPAVAAAVA